jgi:hypothetical protein
LVRQPKEFVISSSDKFEDVDIARDDILFNIVTSDTALKRKDGDKFWRGPKEKAMSLALQGGLYVTSLLKRV